MRQKTNEMRQIHLIKNVCEITDFVMAPNRHSRFFFKVCGRWSKIGNYVCVLKILAINGGNCIYDLEVVG